MRMKALPRVSRLERGTTSTVRSRIADFASDGDEVVQRLSDGLGGQKGDDAACEESQQGAEGGNPGAKGAHAARGLICFVLELPDIFIGLIENNR
jgi:hypothetical protein